MSPYRYLRHGYYHSWLATYRRIIATSAEPETLLADIMAARTAIQTR